MKKLTVILFLIFYANCFAQFSKTHYIPPLSNSNSQEPQGQFMYVSSPSLTPVNFRIIALGGEVVNGTVSRDNPYVFDIGSGFNTQLLVSRFNVSSVMTNKGYIVEAEDQVYVTVRMTTTPQHFQGGGLVSKGLAALGTQFRIGAFLNTGIPSTNDNHYTFGSILATENNTTIQFSDIKPGVSLINNAAAGNTPGSIILNRGESFVIAVEGPNNANRDGLIGALISSDKPIAVNCGSIAGTNGDASNLDLGFDQIVSVERTGKEYIFIKGNGQDVVERPLIVAHEDNTEVFLNSDTVPFITLNAGQYTALFGTQYSADGNLYVHTSKNVFAYQGIGGGTSQANQNMCFVPPLSCETPRIIDNIPYINEIGTDSAFIGTVAIVTETGAELSFIINGTSYELETLPAGVNASGPFNVIGNPTFQTYTFQGLEGNISVYSTRQVYLSYFGSSGAATYGGFYSGFTFKPEVAFTPLDITTVSNCIPNIELSVNVLTAFDTFQWYFNDMEIPGATNRTYIPQAVPEGLGPGFYHVKSVISSCNTELISDKIPVSSCAVDSDADGVNNNIDIDRDNDGILNCTESYGNIPVDSSPANSGSLIIGNYSNTYTVTASGSNGIQPAIPFLGAADGSFVTETTTGTGNSISEKFLFTNPASLLIDYPSTADSFDLLSPTGEFILQVPINQTITVLNPDDQILIDTNFDGIFESGITQFSSFEIRFRLNSGIPLPAGSGTFRFESNLVNSIIYTHKNLSDTQNSKATLKLSLSCVPKDTDSDTVPDQLDFDSDNDGIPDEIEVMGQNFIAIPFSDLNGDGLNDANNPGLGQLDSDNDTVPDYVDSDSDNDGIFDITESGSNGTDADNNGKLDGNPSAFGTNGYLNTLETAADNNILNFSISNIDTDNIQNYIDKDSDGDGCNDVKEAGFTDDDFDGELGNTPLTVNTSNGLVTSGSDGYTPLTGNDYSTSAPITINTQPAAQVICHAQDAVYSIDADSIDVYQWQVSTDGVVFSDLIDNTQYSGTNSSTLHILAVTPTMNGFSYRVSLNKSGNSCGLISAAAPLAILARPNVPASVTLVQCDDDLDGISNFNLKQKESQISTNAANEIFTYYSTQTAAMTADTAFQITNETVYNNSNGNTVWVRIQNNDNCFNVTQMNLVVSATQIPAGTSWSFSRCDDFLDINGNNNTDNNKRDGIASFDFSSVTQDINTILLNNPGFTIKYYKNEADALEETAASGNSLEITNITNYRNIDYPNQQFIWVRIDSNSDNACYGLGPYISLNVEALPVAHPVILDRECDRDTSDIIIDYAFDTSSIEPAILNGQTNVTVTYFDQNNNALPSPLPNPYITATQTITAVLTNTVTASPDGPCNDQVSIDFIVDAKPVANPVTIAPACDDGPDDADGFSSFDTTSIEQTILNGQTGFIVKYTAENGNVLPGPLPNPFNSDTQTITATVENPLNISCPAITTFQFIVNPLPQILEDHSEIICTGIVNESVLLTAGLTIGNANSYSYEWTRNGTVIPNATSDHLTVNEDGVYTTTITNILTGCFRIRTTIVVYSQIATIQDVEIRDLSGNNTVNIIPTGLGSYEFSIDNPTGPFQDSPFFDNVMPGFHDIYVNDKNGCGIVSRQISVVGAPLFFTPNGDSYHDTWKIKGVNALFHKNSIVYIFDRYGKLLKEIPSGTDIGWDGTYNGNPLPADDYWYLLHLDDGRTARGHFTLKR